MINFEIFHYFSFFITMDKSTNKSANLNSQANALNLYEIYHDISF